MTEKLLTLEEAAMRLALTTATLRRWVTEGKVRVAGREPCVPEAEVERLTGAADEYRSAAQHDAEAHMREIEASLPTLQEADERYDRYVQPLEAELWGKFALVLPDGEVFIGDEMEEPAAKAKAAGRQLGPNCIGFKIGPHAVGRV